MTTTPTIKKDKFDILKIIWNEMIISIDKSFWEDVYSEYLEDKEMEKNKSKLTKKYEKSLKSWFWLKI